MDKGHKRHISWFWQHLENVGQSSAKIKREIEDIIVKTLLIAQPSLAHLYRSSQPNDLENNMCFEILGFDIILDHA
jgi:tubulin polyglutamylase TTLL6/13